MSHPRLTTAAVSLGVGLLLLAMTPAVGVLSRLDLWVFERLSGHPGEVVGLGTTEDPRKIEQLGPAGDVASLQVLFLDDEDEGYFEQVPPPPSDVMVLMARLEERGMNAVGIGYPLQWDDPDTLALEGMRRMMDRMDGVVLGYPLKDSTAPEPVAAPFQRSSVAYGDVEGDGTKLPVVNSIRGLSPETGGDRSLAGFTWIETEEADAGRDYLVARWSDRVVFALPLAMEIARLGIAFEDVEIHMGRDIRLGAAGTRIAIDFRGRVDLPETAPEREGLAATAVIAATLPEEFAREGASLFLTDERLLGGKAEREWAKRLGRIDAAVRGAPRVVDARAVPRPNGLVELFSMVMLSLAMAASLSAKRFVMRLAIAGGWLAGVVVLLTLTLHLVGLAPLPTAFMAMPLIAILVVLWVDAGGTIEVVDSREKKASMAEGTKAPRRKRKRRR